jgi:hypothetical protein
METPCGRAILSLYVATTVLVTFNQLIFDKLGQLASFALSALALMVIAYCIFAMAKTGQVDVVSYCVLVAYVFHLITGLLINNIYKEPIISEIIVHTSLYIMIGAAIITLTIIMRIMMRLRR